MIVSPSPGTTSRAEVGLLQDEVDRLRPETQRLEREMRSIQRNRQSGRFGRELRNDALLMVVPALVALAAMIIVLSDASGGS